MDFNNLRDQVSNLTMYDLKAGVRKVQNAVMNYTEMESKVREATNNEPWGASSTLMQEIANGTYSYQMLNEIMPMIYKRFTEKAAEEWRQIYKSLQLLEFLIKNGSERVIDDARGHISLLKMLRQFQYVDQNGKDQGINVRNRAKELAELLSDVERIRSERKKARANRNKFGGVEGGAGIGGGFSGGGGGSRYGGFGSEDAQFGGFSGGVYGDGGGFGGREDSGSRGFSDGSRRDRFEEYDEGDDQPSASTRHNASTRRKPDPPKPKEPEVDLFDFGDDDVPPAAPPKPGAHGGGSSGKQAVDLTGGDDDDDFGDFASAPSSGTAPPQAAQTVSPPPNMQFAQPKPVSGAGASNIQGIMATMSPTPPAGSSGIVSPPPGAGQSMTPLSSVSGGGSSMAAPPMQQQQLPKPPGYQAATPNYFTSVQTQAQNPNQGGRPGMQSQGSFSSNAGGGGIGWNTSSNSGAGASGGAPMSGMAAANAAKSPTGTGAKPKPSGGDAFGSLWSSASASAGIKKNTAAQGPNLASLAKEKTSQGIWGPNAPKSQGQAPQGSMGGQGSGQAPSGQSAGGGLDDLLG